MAKLRVAVLYDVWDDGHEPEEPAPARGRKKPEKEDRQEVHEALRAKRPLAVLPRDRRHDRVAQTLADTECDLVFNLTESWAGDDTKDINLAAFLDLLGKKYNRHRPRRAPSRAEQVPLAKKIFAFHGIRTPYFASVHRGAPRLVARPAVPGHRQPAREDGSIGISFNALCESIKDLMERIHDLHEQFDSPVLIEEYIEGREMYVAVLGNGEPEAAAVVEPRPLAPARRHAEDRGLRGEVLEKGNPSPTR